MFSVTGGQVATIIGGISDTGNAVIDALVNLSPALLAIAGLRWVFGLVKEAVHL